MTVNWIFDFDGTLTHLKIDWEDFKTRFDLAFVSKLWDLPQATRSGILSCLSEIECTGVTSELLISEDFLNSLDSYCVLTNNSEQSVELFFSKMNSLTDKKTVLPKKIVGRETLGGSKEQFELFKRGVELIDREWQVIDRNIVIYVGDQDYELKFAKSLGMIPVHAQSLKEICFK